MLDLTSMPLRHAKEKNVSFDSGYTGSKKCKQGYGDGYSRVWRSQSLVGVWSQAVDLCLCLWQESGLSSSKDVSILN
jgi:hypothetical protein